MMKYDVTSVATVIVHVNISACMVYYHCPASKFEYNVPNFQGLIYDNLVVGMADIF